MSNEIVTPECSRSRAGFTLTEVIVAVGIVILLAGIVLPLTRHLVSQSQRVGISSQFRQIAQAVFLYAVDNEGQLPGPLYSGQGLRFKKGRPEMLFSSIGIYMGQKAPTSQWDVVEHGVMTSQQKAFFQSIPDGQATFYRVTVDGNLKPFGYADTGEPPLNINAIESPSETLMFRELDQQARWASPGSGWYSRIPTAPLHGHARAVSWFDGSVDMVPESESNR